MKTPIQSGGEAMPESKTVTAAGAATPIVDLGHRLGVAMALYAKSEVIASASKKSKAGDANELGRGIAGKLAAAHFHDQELALRDMISMHKAECLEDAAIQIAEAMIRFDMIWDQFPREDETFQVIQDYRAIERLLRSAFDFINEIVPQKVGEIVSTGFTNDITSPWSHMENVREQEVPA